MSQAVRRFRKSRYISAGEKLRKATLIVVLVAFVLASVVGIGFGLGVYLRARASGAMADK